MYSNFFSVTSLADALRLDFALIHKDRSRLGPQGHNRPYSGMPKSGEGDLQFAFLKKTKMK